MSLFAPRAPVGCQPIANNSTTAQHQLGMKVSAWDTATTAYGDGEFIYLKGVGSTVVGSVVTFNQDDHSTALLVASAIGPVAVAMSACVASQFGWYQIYGKGVALVAPGFANDANCYATATPGTIDDTIVAGDRVKGMKGASAVDTPEAGKAEVELHHPFMDDALAA